jgi:hypothetical protein
MLNFESIIKATWADVSLDLYDVFRLQLIACFQELLNWLSLAHDDLLEEVTCKLVSHQSQQISLLFQQLLI